MPTLYPYATDEVEGTIFDNIQRRIAHTENAGAYRLTEYPVKDITDGKADKFIEILIEDLASLNTSINSYTDMLKMDRDLLTYETGRIENLSQLKQNVKANIKNIYLIERDMVKYERKLKTLRDLIQYVSLTNFLDFRTAYDTLLTSIVDLVGVGTDLLDFLMEDGLIKTKGYDEVLVDTQGINEPDEGLLYRRKITDKMLKKKMAEISKRPDFVWYIGENIDPSTGLPEYEGLSPDEYEKMIGEQNRVALINQALEELGEREFHFNPNQKQFEDDVYDLWYDKMERIFNEKRFIKATQQAIKKERQKQTTETGLDPVDVEGLNNPDYVPFEPNVSYDEDGNEVEILEPDEPFRTPNIYLNPKATEEDKELEEIYNEEKELLRGIKLLSTLLKRINEPFKKLWENLTNIIMRIDDDMRNILNNFNEFRQQVLNNPNTLDQEKEDILQNPYGMTGKGFSDFAEWEKRNNNMMKYYDYKDGKWTPKEGYNYGKDNISLKYVGFNPRDRPKPNIAPQLEGGYVGLSHPSRREMARYYGAGGSKYI